MYFYKFAHDDYDTYVHVIFTSKVKYSKQELYDILKDILQMIYEVEDYPPVPCLLDWGEVFYYMTQDPYEKYLKKQYYLQPFVCNEVIRTIDNMEFSECADNIYCHYREANKACLNSRSVGDSIEYGQNCYYRKRDNHG